MSAAERELLAAAVEGCRSGLEFGCGGSTALMLRAGLPRLLSADSDPAWLARVGVEPSCAEALATGALRLLHVDIGPTGAWGWPEDAAGLARWPAYWRDPWEAACTDGPPPDLVLVDGRFRIAAALFGLPRLAPEARLLVHDFWPREAYRPPLLRHCSVAATAGSLVMLAPNPRLDPALLAADLAAHGFDPR